MNTWFTVKVKYTKQLENGSFKRVSEPYLMASMTFTDAEARVYEELGSIIRGEFNVISISRTEVHDIFHYEDADVWYKCKITYESVDGEGEKSKKVSQNFLVSANSVKQAYERMQESLSTLMADFEIPSIVISPIVDIFPYAENLDKELSRTSIEEHEKNTSKSKVFSASGSDEDDVEDEESSHLEDEYNKD